MMLRRKTRKQEGNKRQTKARVDASQQTGVSTTRQLFRYVKIGVVGVIIVVATTGFWAPERWQQNIDTRINQAFLDMGFGLSSITIDGAQRTGKEAVLHAADLDVARHIFAQDLEHARDHIQNLPWVKTVAVRRTLPGDISIQIDEYHPFALWQLDGEVSLIDREGHVIIAASAKSYPQLPMLVGKGASDAVVDLAEILAGTPDLAVRVQTAIRVGERRWDLKFDNGVLLNLPEEAANLAWQRFAKLQNGMDILEQGYVRLDLRLPDMLVVRPPSQTPTLKVEKRGQQT